MCKFLQKPNESNTRTYPIFLGIISFMQSLQSKILKNIKTRTYLRVLGIVSNMQSLQSNYLAKDIGVKSRCNYCKRRYLAPWFGTERPVTLRP